MEGHARCGEHTESDGMPGPCLPALGDAPFAGIQSGRRPSEPTHDWWVENGRRAAIIRWSRRKYRFCSTEECERELPQGWKGALCLECRRRKGREQKRRSRKRPGVLEKHRLLCATYYQKNREKVLSRARARYWRKKLEGAK